MQTGHLPVRQQGSGDVERLLPGVFACMFIPLRSAFAAGHLYFWVEHDSSKQFKSRSRVLLRVLKKRATASSCLFVGFCWIPAAADSSMAKKTRKTAKPTTQSPSTAKHTSAKPAKYPRHSVEKALRIPKAILEQNGRHTSALVQAAGYLGLTNPRGPFAVEIGSAKKFGFLDSPEDQLDAFREAVLQAPDIADV